MYHIIHETNPQNEYKVAILIKKAALIKDLLEEHYVQNFNMPPEDIISFSLEHGTKKKVSVSTQKEYLSRLLPELVKLNTTTLYVCDGEYFKTLTKSRKAEPHYGYVLPCAIEGFEHLKVVLSTNYQALFKNPQGKDKIDLATKTLNDYSVGQYTELGKNIINFAEYPDKPDEIEVALKKLHNYPALTCDIECFSLRINKAGLATITFCWDQHNGIAFPIDYVANVFASISVGRQGFKRKNTKVRKLLKAFFEAYKGKLIYHNANFDIKILIAELFMDDLLDQEGMIEGLQVMTRNIEDTKIISYLATNSTAGNNLGLKFQAHEFAGNYAVEDIKDVLLIKQPKLLEYNLVDGLSTWYVYNKHRATLIADNQEQVYQEIFLPSIKNILQMELTGMPINMPEVLKVKKMLSALYSKYRDALITSPVILKHIDLLRNEEFLKKNLEWVKKQEPLEYFNYVSFNPRSPVQLQRLLYTELGFEVIDFTDSKLPATGAKTLKKLIHKTKDKDVISVLNNLIELSDVSKMLDTFIKAFEENSICKADGNYYLHGNFNLGGTVSGRLSSSGPNLQNLPSNSKYAKDIKRCFKGEDGWLFVGADFNSLEDYISALTTRDPNKLKVYEQGFDGHCLRAAYYYRDELAHIDYDDPVSVNSIKDSHPHLRQDSKPCTFALTYQGMWLTLVNNLGLSPENAKRIEHNYHELYHVSDAWVQAKLDQAANDGYVTVAFDLRVRTPVLAQTLRNTRATPFEAEAEGRTAGNALGQSYGLLNNRAANEMQERILRSPYAQDIRPCAHIHDAQYFLIRDDLEVVEWFNTNLIQCMAWQELEELQHDVVKIGAALDVFYPDWSNEITLPNDATQAEIKEACQKGIDKYNKKLKGE